MSNSNRSGAFITPRRRTQPDFHPREPQHEVGIPVLSSIPSATTPHSRTATPNQVEHVISPPDATPPAPKVRPPAPTRQTASLRFEQPQAAVETPPTPTSRQPMPTLHKRESKLYAAIREFPWQSVLVATLAALVLTTLFRATRTKVQDVSPVPPPAIHYHIESPPQFARSAINSNTARVIQGQPHESEILTPPATTDPAEARLAHREPTVAVRSVDSGSFGRESASADLSNSSAPSDETIIRSYPQTDFPDLPLNPTTDESCFEFRLNGNIQQFKK